MDPPRRQIGGLLPSIKTTSAGAKLQSSRVVKHVKALVSLCAEILLAVIQQKVRERLRGQRIYSLFL